MRTGLASPNAAEIKSLVNVALGAEKADLIVMGGDLVNVYTGELLKGYSIATKGKWIAYVGSDVIHAIGPETEVIDASGKTIIPGFIDGHTHFAHYYSLEEFVKYAMWHGTTTVIIETTDHSFVLGYEGVIQFLEAAANQPIKILATAPAIVANRRDGYADIINAEMLHELLQREEVMGLGESNWLPVIKGNDQVLDLFADVLSLGKTLEGHSSGARGNKLAAYVASGISSCHESITADEALEKLRLGLHVMIREGYTRKDLKEVSQIKDQGFDSRRLAVATDGLDARYLIEHGYMDSVAQKAIDLGFDPVTAIQMATLNVAEHFSIGNIVGGIAPGKCADIVIIPNTATIKPECVISNGRIVARDGKLLVEPKQYTYPESSRTTVRLPRKLDAADFAIQTGSEAGEVVARVIDLSSSIVNKEALLAIPVSEGELKSDISRDILKVAAIDRADNSGKMFVGLVRGFQLRKGALAATASWGVSNVLVTGVSEEDMAKAVNRIRELQGGVVVYADGEVRAELPMPIAGWITDLPMEAVAEGLEGIQRELAKLGCQIPDAHFILTTLTTPIIPALRISTGGLIAVKEGKVIDLVVS